MDRSFDALVKDPANAGKVGAITAAQRRRASLASRKGYAAVTAIIENNQKQFESSRDKAFDTGFMETNPPAGLKNAKLTPNPVPDTPGHSLLLWDTAGFKGQLETGPPPLYAGLTSARQMAERQESANRKESAIAARASMEGLTLRTGLQDIREVILGIPHDLMNATRPQALWTTCSKNNRLRGMGLLLLIAALASLVVL